MGFWNNHHGVGKPKKAATTHCKTIFSVAGKAHAALALEMYRWFSKTRGPTNALFWRPRHGHYRLIDLAVDGTQSRQADDRNRFVMPILSQSKVYPTIMAVESGGRVDKLT
jgi:hypothetical protein